MIRDAWNKANNQLTGKAVMLGPDGYDAFAEAKRSWLYTLLHTVAPILGCVAEREDWRAEDRRMVLEIFASEAAAAAGLKWRRIFGQLEGSGSWKSLDDALFRGDDPTSREVRAEQRRFEVRARAVVFAQNLNRFREQAAFTQEELAETMDIGIDILKSHSRMSRPKLPGPLLRQRYASTISRRLLCPVTVEDLLPGDQK